MPGLDPGIQAERKIDAERILIQGTARRVGERAPAGPNLRGAMRLTAPPMKI